MAPLSRIRVFPTELGSWYSLAMTTNEPTDTTDDMVISSDTLAAISDPTPRLTDEEIFDRAHARGNVERADKLVAMLVEMVQACEIIADRYEDKCDGVTDLRNRLASATAAFHEAVEAAFAAGLTQPQIADAAKRYGLYRDALNAHR